MLKDINKSNNFIPAFIRDIGLQIIKSGFEVFLVGGSVRDLLIGNTVKDWDIATNAKPEEIIKIFPDSFYNNTFGTVGVKTNEGIVEITTFRKEGIYSDSRHPDKVEFASSIEEDLKRRDFTVNAIALDLKKIFSNKENIDIFSKLQRGKEMIRFEDSLRRDELNNGPGIEGNNRNLIQIDEIPKLGFRDYPTIYVSTLNFSDQEKSKIKEFVVDQFNGLEDLKCKLIRAVGDPQKRFQEDALRLMRAVRFSVQLGFKIEKNTAKAIKENSHLLQKISKERIKDELSKIILSPWPAEGIKLLEELDLLKFIIPEMEEGIGVSQDRHHIYSVYDHLVLSLKFCFDDSLEIRLASLFHDIGKPRVKKTEKGKPASFHFHEVEGEKMARKILYNLKFSKDTINETAKLVRYHMFNFDPNEHNENTVRRMLYRVGGQERMKKLHIIRIADRLGSGCKQGEVFKLRKLKYLIEKTSFDPISLKQLKVNGSDLMKELKIKPGPHIGSILNILLARAIEDPKKNNKKELLEIASILWKTEENKPGTIAKIQKESEDFLNGKKREHDFKLQSKYKVIEKTTNNT